MAELVRVTFEYDSGKIEELTGDIARKWLEDANGMIFMGWAHGMSFPAYTWGEVKPDVKTALVRVLGHRVEQLKGKP